METRGVWEPDADTDFGDFGGRGRPKKLMFTLTGKCNLRCQHCFRGIAHVAATQTPRALVDYVLDHVVPGVRSIRLGGTDLGEQLTSRHISHFLRRMLSYPDKHLEIISNLTLMNAETADLLSKTCGELRFSLEGVGAAFETVRGFPWSTIQRNLDMLTAARQRNAGSRLRIIALVTCFHDNLHELAPILDLVDRGVDRIEYRLFIPNSAAQVSQSLDHHRAEANKVFHRLREEADRRGISVQVPRDLPVTPLAETVRRSAPASPTSTLADDIPSERSPWVCQFPFETISILSDGQIGTCCKDIRFGTIDPQQPRLETIWRGRSWQKLRRAVATERWDGACATCDYRLERDPHGDAVRNVRHTSGVSRTTTRLDLPPSAKRLAKRLAALVGVEIRRRHPS